MKAKVEGASHKVKFPEGQSLTTDQKQRGCLNL